jgi:hypothetical protein
VAGVINNISEKSPEELAEAIDAAMRNRLASRVVIRTRDGESVTGVYEGVVGREVSVEVDEVSQSLRAIPCAAIESFEIYEPSLDRSDELRG